jgi:hypothetical protein
MVFLNSPRGHRGGFFIGGDCRAYPESGLVSGGDGTAANLSSPWPLREASDDSENKVRSEIRWRKQLEEHTGTENEGSDLEHHHGRNPLWQ